MSRRILGRWRRVARLAGSGIAAVAVVAGAGAGVARAQNSGRTDPRDALTEFLCCGQTTGGCDGG